MCHRDTISQQSRRLVRVLGCLALLCSLSNAQNWVRVGTSGVATGLAGLAGGPINAVWYSANGLRLFAKTDAGRIFETTDFDHWQLNQTEPAPAARLQTTGGRIFRTGGKNLFASDNGGKTWINLTGFNDVSIVGGGAGTMAVNPRSPQELTIGNAHGLWQSMDSGLTWHGLNDGLPNFPVAKLLGQRAAQLKDGTAVNWSAGNWVPFVAAEIKAQASGTVSAQKDATIYSGSVDGRLFVSLDAGKTWVESPKTASGAVTRIWLDGDRPSVALAIAGGRLYRTVNAGVFWDDVTGSMPAMDLRAVTADRSASVLYAATDRGIYSASLSLNDAGAAARNWISVSGELPVAPAVDVQYNLDGTLTVALEGYGIYEAAAPHKTKAIRLLSGADLTERPAAPGSLVSVVGAKLLSARTGELRYPVVQATDAGTQLQVPFEAGIGILSLVMDSGLQEWSLPLTVRESAPAIFVDSDGSPLLLDVETGLVVDTKTALAAGSRVQILATGLGKVSPDWPTGMPAPIDSPPVVRGLVTAFLDGFSVEVVRATLAPGYVGYYTVELQLPQIVNRGANDFTLVMNGERSNRVKLYLEQSK